MALSVDEQALFDAAVAALPAWFTKVERNMEDLAMFAKTNGAALAIAKFWESQTFIDQAVGATGLEPDWLNEHARDRGTSRVENETDAALRVRIKTAPDAVTPDAIIEGVLAAVLAAGGTWDETMEEFPRDSAYLIDSITQNTGTGGTFGSVLMLTFGSIYTNAVESDVGKTVVQGANNGVLQAYNNTTKTWWVTKGVGTIIAGATTITTGTGAGTSTAAVADGIVFTPTVAFAYPPYPPEGERIKKVRIIVSGAANAGNNGTYLSTGVLRNGIRFVNGAAVAAVDATVSWALGRYDAQDAIVDGFVEPYLYDVAETTPVNEGVADRMGPAALCGICIILPFGTPAAVPAAVLEAARQRKLAGVVVTVETRTVA